MNNSKTVLFLEPKGTILEVVRAAKARGYRVVAWVSDKSLLDSAPDPYATAVPLIDQVVAVESWQSRRVVLEAFESLRLREQIVGVFAGLDPCALVLAEMRSRLGLPTPSSERVAQVLNKYELRRKLYSLGLSGLKNIHGTEADHLISWPFKGAAYFKPVHGFFSAYVERCENLDDLWKAREAWRRGNATDPAFVRNYVRSQDEYVLEEAFDGELLSVEGFAHQGKFSALGLLSRILYSKNPIVEMGSCFPYPHRSAERVIEVVAKAHQALGFSDGPTHTEVIVNTAGEVEIIDWNPRFVGADVLQSINHAFEVKMEEQLLNFALGEAVELPNKIKNYACLQYVLPPAEARKFDAIKFPRQAEVKFTTSYCKPGSEIQSSERQLDYLGCYLTLMPTFSGALSRSRELREEVWINHTQQGVY